MPRIGQNPSRGQSLDFTPARTTVAVLVYAPHQAGYFENRMDVTRLTIESILANTKSPFDLLVFNNGSCPEISDYLQSLYDQGSIDYLIHSKRNIGKLNALKIIFNSAPGEIVAYTDDGRFPSSGMVGGTSESFGYLSQGGGGDGLLYPGEGRSEFWEHPGFCQSTRCGKPAGALDAPQVGRGVYDQCRSIAGTICGGGRRD